MVQLIHDPVVDMRAGPGLGFKVVSQALFAEPILVEKREVEWAFIQTPDGYKGWVPESSFVDSKWSGKQGDAVSRVAAHLYSIPDIEYGPKKTLPFGVRLKKMKWEDPRWAKVLLPNGEEGYIQKGDLAEPAMLREKGQLVSFSEQFLGLPYTWGGRSSFGFDCSGFVQMLYSQIGVLLPRDSKDQVLDRRFISIPFEKLEPGDLIFFGKSAEAVHHVGMFLGNQKMIHSSSKENKPFLRISDLSDFEWSGNPRCVYSFRTARQVVSVINSV